MSTPGVIDGALLNDIHFMLLLEAHYKRRFTRKTQETVKTWRFYRIAERLVELKYLKMISNGGENEYQITIKGNILTLFIRAWLKRR